MGMITFIGQIYVTMYISRIVSLYFLDWMRRNAYPKYNHVDIDIDNEWMHQLWGVFEANGSGS